MEDLLTASEVAGEPLVWTLAQLLERLPVSRSTIYRWIEREGLPVIRIGKSSNPLFLRDSVLGWLQSRELSKAPIEPAPTANTVALVGERHPQLRRTARRSRARRTPPPPLATAGTRERLRRVHGAR